MNHVRLTREFYGRFVNVGNVAAMNGRDEGMRYAIRRQMEDVRAGVAEPNPAELQGMMFLMGGNPPGISWQSFSTPSGGVCPVDWHFNGGEFSMWTSLRLIHAAWIGQME